MENSGIKTLSTEELEKIFVIGRIKHYEDLADFDYLTEYYILTGEIPENYESAQEILKEMVATSQMP